MGRRFASATAAVALVLLGGLATPAAAEPPSVYEPTFTPSSGAAGAVIKVTFPPDADLGDGENLIIDKCAAAFVTDPVLPTEPPLCPRDVTLTVPDVRPQLLPLRWKVQRNQKSVAAPQEGTFGFKVAGPTSGPGPETSAVVSESPSPPVEVIDPEFGVSVSPLSAPAGDRITVEVFPVDESVRIIGCLVAFPGDAGAECLLSAGRWLADVPIPAGTPAGLHLLRWGVQARAADRRPVARNGTIRYRVAALAVVVASPSPSRTPDPTVPASPQVFDLGPPPKFVAAAEPASALAGEKVTVAVSPVEPGTAITDCLVTFAGGAGTTCVAAGGRWTATVAVPVGTAPGRVPLRWGVTFRTADGRRGADNDIVDYEVRPPGTVRPPAFAVRPQPAAARAGERVSVSHVSLVDGVSITACTAGFAEDRAAACRPDGGGWIADVAVPDRARPGPGTLLWRVAYQRAGTTGARDGLLSFTVLSSDAGGGGGGDGGGGGGGFWRPLLAQAGKVALLGSLVVVFIAGRGLLSRVRKLFRTDGDGDHPDTAPRRRRRHPHPARPHDGRGQPHRPLARPPRHDHAAARPAAAGGTMTQAVDLRTILFEDPSRAADAITGALVDAKPGEELGAALGRMPDSAKKAVLERVGTAAGGLLELDITDIIGMAWRKHTALREAAAATLAEPGSMREVQMASHTVSFGHEPAVELWLAERKIATVALRIGLELRLRAVTACVRQGRLTAVGAGSCDAEGTLTIMDSVVARRQVTINLPLALRLGRGLNLGATVAAPTA